VSRTTRRSVRIRTSIDPELNGEDYRTLLDDISARRLAGLVFCFEPRLAAGTPLVTTPDLPRISLCDHPLRDVPRVLLDCDRFWNRAFEYLVGRGRRRIAIVCPPGVFSWIKEYLPRAARDFGVTIDEAWVQSVDQKRPEWAEHLVQLLLRGRAQERPDGLIVSDDNLLDYACRGLVKTDARLEEDLDVVGHANFPTTGVDILPVCRLGYDIRRQVLESLELIDALRRGEKVADPTMIPAVFSSELDQRPDGASDGGLVTEVGLSIAGG
jgi:DNA-binding LacI/PurR family transcriptional regulator